MSKLRFEPEVKFEPELEIEIEWEGPFTCDEIINAKSKQSDIGLYQIYGRHQLYGNDALLYIGETTVQNFSTIMKQNKSEWLHEEQEIQIYTGKIIGREKKQQSINEMNMPERILLSKAILLYKYFPIYNSKGISEEPKLEPKKIRLIHKGSKYRLDKEDNAPKDFKWPEKN